MSELEDQARLAATELAPRFVGGWPAPFSKVDDLEALITQALTIIREKNPSPVVDPTTIPQPRRWGTAIRGPFAGERVYWDQGLHDRHENAWTNVPRSRRYSPDMVKGDRKEPQP
jgi:hypothetical protein